MLDTWKGKINGIINSPVYKDNRTILSLIIVNTSGDANLINVWVQPDNILITEKDKSLAASKSYTDSNIILSAGSSIKISTTKQTDFYFSFETS